jgi:adenylosuccinate synthase
MASAVEDAVRQRGREYGASTGRPRRCGWFDAVVVKYAARLNGFDSLALMKLDVLDELDEIPVCTAYRCESGLTDELPADHAVLQACEPVYEILPGWRASTAGIREFGQLPEQARRYVDRLSEMVGVEIGMVSTGPERTQTLLRGQSRMASWFE